MRRLSFLCAAVAALAVAVPANAHVAHTVEPGETLWSIASESNFTTRALAASNGLSEDAQVQAGTTISIPSEGEAVAALAGAPAASPVAAAEPAVQPAPAANAAPDPSGAYTVQPGDTLNAIAARSGVTAQQVAWMNGVDANGVLLAGTVLKVPTSSPLAGQTSAPVEQKVVPPAAPYATPGQVSAGDVGTVASNHGVPPSLAVAIAWQESGFQNGVVSAANARGVMQILPGTWTWVQQNLSERTLDPASPIDNVHAGVLYLSRLIRDAGGDEALGAASYYQGPASVRRLGMLPETQRYVENVMALRARFGG
jgi:LysM repeat protein